MDIHGRGAHSAGSTRSGDGTELHSGLSSEVEPEMEAIALVRKSIDEGKAPL